MSRQLEVIFHKGESYGIHLYPLTYKWTKQHDGYIVLDEENKPQAWYSSAWLICIRAERPASGAEIGPGAIREASTAGS